MPVTILSPEQSFVQFSPPDMVCNNYQELCLPAVGKFDISFQFIIDSDLPIASILKKAIATNECQVIQPLIFNANNITPICNKRVIDFPAGLFFLHQVTLNGVIKLYDLNNQTAESVMLLIAKDFEIKKVGSNAILECCDNEIIVEVNQQGSFNNDFSDDFDNGGSLIVNTYVAWHIAYFDLNNIPITIINVGNCYRYAIVNSADEIIACSNCFKVSDDLCFTTFLTYQNVEDAFGFLYGTDVYNRIRLPFYLRAPTTPAVKKIYRKSNGQYKTLSSIYDRQYALLTDYLPDWFHEKMAIAVGHDYVKMDNALFKVSGEVNVDGYTPDWQDDDTFLLAMGKATVKHAKYNYKNDSCGKNGCNDYVPTPLPPCLPPDLQVAMNLPDAIINTAYDYTIVPNGTKPFGISKVIKPDWMTIILSGQDVLFIGIPNPGYEGSDIAVSFRITNECGSGDFSGSINVTPASTGVMFGATTFVAGDALIDYEKANIIGVPNSTVTIKLDHRINTNGGKLRVQGAEAYEGNTFDVTLDSDGNGFMTVSIEGIANVNTVILGHFTITSVSSGTIGSPYIYQISKAF